MRNLFYKVYLERHLVNHPNAKRILRNLAMEPVLIERLEDVFGNPHKPYLAKNKTLSLIIAEKHGNVVKEAPPAYGKVSTLREKHFYFIHAYNCIYACEYCYLQGYFHSPDIVLFVNHDAILKVIAERIDETLAQGKTPYFHSGEFSDSLALSGLSGELAAYFDFFKTSPRAYLELRTKSAKITPLLAQTPLANVITSFSLAPEEVVKRYDHKTASLKARLKAIHTLTENGFPVALHLDPIIYTEDYIENYQTLARAIQTALSQNAHLLRHISLGTLRFSAEVWKKVKTHYPFSTMVQAEWTAQPGFDGKIRYPAPLRKWLLHNVKQTLLDCGLAESLIYNAME